MNIGKFIVLDGIDGSGTTTHTKALKGWLKKQGYSVVLTEEPTNRKIGSLIRTMIKTKETSSTMDALLFAADRLDHLANVIEPALTAGKIVISDRYFESSIAYQTVAGVEMNWVMELNKFVKNPDLTIILDIEPEIGLARKAKIEGKFEEPSFLHKVREIYLQRARSQQYPIVKTNRSIAEVQKYIQELIQASLK
ncbi:MAG TPA: dTMP kinase [Candidatus Deferrimicrobium sp.]|nr:dTMP kinase [Candidatus Deferrimicrobium sp.]